MRIQKSEYVLTVNNRNFGRSEQPAVINRRVMSIKNVPLTTL